MSTNTRRAVMGPSWTEVILGAVLSALLGGALGLVLLVIRPVTKVKEVPKEPAKGAFYYLEGSRESAKAGGAAQKRTAFVGGQSVSVVEDELNALISGPAPAAAKSADKAGDKGKAAEKAKEPEKTAGDGMLSLGKPDVRIRDGVLQLAVPVTVNTFDLGLKLTAQARGTFVKKGDLFVYEPTEWSLGALPLHRMPVLGAVVRDQFVSGQAIPDDIKAAWKKATQVAIDGSTLKITMP